MTRSVAIHWFRQDLRIADNPSLYYAAQKGEVMPIYILDTTSHKNNRAIGGASRWWLHHSLNSLQKSLSGKLYVFTGSPIDILKELANKYAISNISWNRCYDAWGIERDAEIKNFFKQSEIEVKTFNGSLLWEPWEVLKDDKTPYKVFTPFYKKGCLQKAPPPMNPLPKPENLKVYSCEEFNNIDKLGLIPQNDWHRKLEKHWEIGEKAANYRLNNFLKIGINDYKEGRNYPAKNNVSCLSPYLHFGEISPHTIWHEVKKLNRDNDENIAHFLSELGWREFSNYLLYHFPSLPSDNFQKKFNSFPWVKNDEFLLAWQKGITGYPIIDAGIRELWQTGYMHNRVRMVVASFLVKNLLIHWHSGEEWFWDCLVDADTANNSASWQWVAGSGADAAPYFRIFNPVTQGVKFDEHGEYTKKYVPELASLPNKYLFEPWKAPQSILSNSNVKLGINYPKPIIDLAFSREQALLAYKSI